jgi:hypothetical protein
MRLFKRPLTFVSGFVIGTLVATIPVAWALTDNNPNQFDATSPTLVVQPAEFVIGSSIDAAAEFGSDGCSDSNNNVPMRLRWKVADPISGIDHIEVWTTYAGHAADMAASYEGGGTTSYAYGASNYDGSCGGGSLAVEANWVRTQDLRGNTAASALVRAEVQVWDENAIPVEYYASLGTVTMTRTGTWSVSNCTCFNHGHTSYATASGASRTYTVTTTRPGQTLALVMEKAANRGVVKISVDGGTATSVDTYAVTPTHRVIVWQKALAAPGAHTIKLVNAATSGRPRIDVDSLVLASGTGGLAPTYID